MIGMIQDISTMHDVLHESKTGLWIIEIEDGGQPRMFADQTMMELLGLKAVVTPEKCYEHWYERIAGEYYPVVNACVEEMVKTGRAEVQYPWYHPDLGKIYIRCGGVADRTYSKGMRLRGYHQNVTDTTVMRREKEKLEERIRKLWVLCITFSSLYTGLILRKALSAPYVSPEMCRKSPRETFPMRASGMIMPARIFILITLRK